jgi:hypothetical protein
LFGLIVSLGITVDAAKFPCFPPKLSELGTTALMPKFLLFIPLVVGLTVFSLSFGLRMVGEETGDFDLLFGLVIKAEGLPPLIVFKLAGSFDLLDLASITMIPY